ncbi:uncharacterized protein KY384_003157 [Bacidia gigantensis]|uniref:uncharacterized protein n=1 Tax=Bacidia gigantensis TaxID=2732470 RepID=UPI001D0534CE|nr:uncharacterized protein KY384_003157 [Bacidia gigantensis]KAG8531528.1 hypothetical protein KY384_003157 [Bacidia gigantensis]
MPDRAFVQDLLLLAATSGDEKEQVERRNNAAAVLRRLDAQDDDDDDDDEIRENGGRKRKRPKVDYLQLNRYEQLIAMDVVAPDDIPVAFDGGLADTIEELKEAIIYPLTMPELFSNPSSLLSAPSGVLLFGPPGCGKTMLAKAMAHEGGATFINLHISTLTEKWYGDSNKLVHAVFTLARKLQPTIIFIDEIDALLGTRRSGEHEASGQVKAEFMTHWDGLISSDSTGKSQSILILGATNRIQDIDEAILRRMPKKFPVPLPSAKQRQRIFGLVLKGTKMDEDDFDLDYLVRVAAGMSGSDIKEACRDAALIPMREYVRQRKASGAQMENADMNEMRGLKTSDFFEKTGSVRIVGTQG